MALTFNAKMKKRFAYITSNSQKLNEYIHETALLIFDHAVATGDCRMVKDLYDSMPASFRRQKMLDWFKEFSPIRFNSSTGKVGLLTEKQKGFTPFNRESAVETPWYTLADLDPEAKTYDFAALVQMVSRLSKQIEKKVEDGLVPEEDIPSAHAIAQKIAKLDLKRVKPVEPANEQAEEQAAA